MKAVTPEGYTFVTKFQEDNFHKVLRSVDFFSIKFDEIFFDTVCWVVTLYTIAHLNALLYMSWRLAVTIQVIIDIKIMYDVNY